MVRWIQEMRWDGKQWNRKRWNRRKRHFLALGMAGGLLISSVAGCGTAAETGNTNGGSSGGAEQISESVSGGEEDESGMRENEIQASSTETEKEEENKEEQNVGEETVISAENGNIRISGTGAKAAEHQVTISSAGTYRLTGTLEEGQILVDAGKDDEIRLILDNFSISNSNSSAIYGVQSGCITIETAENTHNSVTDGTSYQYDTEGEDEPNAAIFSKDDIVLEGNGILEVNGQYQDGIRGKDDLTIKAGEYRIQAINDAIKGKDSVQIEGGTFVLQAGGDGIQSSNDTDTEKGYVRILGGTFTIQAEKKGILSETGIEIVDGTFSVTSEDDAIHSNGDVTISGGTLTLSTEDDAVHADGALSVSAGVISVEKSYEGLEGLTVDISGGTISIVSEDDGINAAGGVDASGNQDRFGGKAFSVTEGAYIKIIGGEVFVSALGDGLDSNGDLFVEGGTIYVEGPESNGNSALDFDGTGTISGGILMATGSSGMVQMFSQDSSQASIAVFYDGTKQAGSTVHLLDSEGKEVLERQVGRAFSCLILSTPDLRQGETYEIQTGEESVNVQVDGAVTQYGNSSGRGGFGRGGMGAGKDGMERPEAQGDAAAGRGGAGRPQAEGESGSGRGGRGRAETESGTTQNE